MAEWGNSKTTTFSGAPGYTPPSTDAWIFKSVVRRNERDGAGAGGRGNQ